MSRTLEEGASAEPPVRLCPAGRHAMDPGWQVCPYCASESSNRADTTHRSADPAAEKRGATVFGAEGEPSRRIVGVLVTYTWRPDGEIFPVREGRNLLGSSPECEIRIATDPRMSARHACIVHRPGGFWIDDEKSMNGTFLGEESVDEKR